MKYSPRKAYVFPPSRAKMIIIGALVSLLLVVYFLFDTGFRQGVFLSRGPLSSNHAGFQENCESCHVLKGDVADEKCSVCHEKTGDRTGVYSYSAHYVYRSRDISRVQTASVEHGGNEMACYSCHSEHMGRDAQITNVSDVKCLTCHGGSEFESGHPEFDFMSEKNHDDSSLAFTHIRHTGWVLEKMVKEEGAALIEKACLTCHEPDPDGSNFARLDFEKHCADCHLTGGMESAALNVAGKNGDKAGVETLEMIRKRMGPRARWAYYMNPNEFDMKAGGRKVVKSPLSHADPWILENLNVLRRQLYPELELAELTKASGEVGLANVNDVHSEALEKLQAYSDELKSRREEEVAIEIKTIDSLIRKLRREIELESFTSSPRLTEKSFFDPTSATLDPSLSPEKINELKGLVVSLTGKNKKLCQQCHTVQYASVMRVSAEQEILNRVEFNHRAHILESGCLDCHTDIPVTAEMSAGKTVDSTLDRAAVQNIPGIKNCRSCHTSSGASTNCVSCHLFHPNKNNRGSLQLFVGAR